MFYIKSTLTKFLTLLIIFNLFSCIALKDIQLLQPSSDLKLNKNGKIAFDKPEYHIQVNDQLLINVSSASPSSMGILQDFISTGNISMTTRGGLNGVYVREDGTIELPRIGKIKLEGLTLEEARKSVQTEFYKIYDEKGTYIDVNLAGIEYTVVGEAGQGVYRAQKKNLTLLDAFAQSGSNNIYANLNKVRIIRTDVDGTKQAFVDLTDESVMNSEYYWVQNNDIIVVDPRKQKVWGIGLNPLTAVTAIAGSIVSIIGIFLFFDKL